MRPINGWIYVKDLKEEKQEKKTESGIFLLDSTEEVKMTKDVEVIAAEDYVPGQILSVMVNSMSMSYEGGTLMRGSDIVIVK